MAKQKPESDRGKVVDIELSSPIYFNGNEITDAMIEIDHINHGIDKKTKKLNKSKRSNFTVKRY